MINLSRGQLTLLQEWVSGDRGAIAEWDYAVTDGIASHKVHRQTQLLFSEIWDQAEWGDWYWSTKVVSGLSFQSGRDQSVRGVFSDTGALPNTKDTNYRAIRDQWPVFGFAVNLGLVAAEPVSTLFTLGLTQDLAIQFLGKDGLVPVPSLWKSYFEKDTDAVSCPLRIIREISAEMCRSPSSTTTTPPPPT